MRSDESTLTIFTDGSVAPNNNGGVGIRIISIDSNGDDVINPVYSVGHQNVNSGQMEIIACTVALQEAVQLQLTSSIKKVVIFTDSKYVADNYKKAMFEWAKNQWRRNTGRPVPDAHLWKELVKQIAKYVKDRIYVEIKWVKGHEKNEHNKAVDEMAKKASKSPSEKIPKNGAITAFKPRKVVSSSKVKLGSVKMKGQKISIRILSCQFLIPQKIWRYQYEVISNKSPFRGFVDQIFSLVSLDEGRSYYVKFNSVTANPTIERRYRELGDKSV